MNFQYFTTKVINAELEVDDIGSCAIKGFNDLGAEYILIIETQLGVSRILTAGPVQPDFDLLPDATDIQFQREEFNERKIGKIISGFLNNSKAQITQAFQCDKQEALDDCRDLIGYMNQADFW